MIIGCFRGLDQSDKVGPWRMLSYKLKLKLSKMPIKIDQNNDDDDDNQQTVSLAARDDYSMRVLIIIGFFSPSLISDIFSELSFSFSLREIQNILVFHFYI